MLTVSTLASLAAKWLLPRLSAFQEAHPGIDVRITTSTALVDFRNGDVDAAIRYGRGQLAGPARRLADGGRGVSGLQPGAAHRQASRCECPEDLRDHVLLHTSNANSDDWRLWLTAAGLPTDISKQPGITFDLILMTVQAAIDGIGVAMGRTSYVQDDIAKGRLVVPFKIALPADAGFYLVSPEGAAEPPKLTAFRQWLLASAQEQGLKSKPEYRPMVPGPMPLCATVISGWSRRAGVADCLTMTNCSAGARLSATGRSETGRDRPCRKPPPRSRR